MPVEQLPRQIFRASQTFSRGRLDLHVHDQVELALTGLGHIGAVTTHRFAYRTLDAGTGALILFGAVQATMILASFIEGHRPQVVEWIGMSGAFGGLV
ncbi:MAG: hypothetical protein LJE70_13185 [Chromatiaceae bacterium]|nr:hypothetical protein [Chromatiaceae bacterium]